MIKCLAKMSDKFENVAQKWTLQSQEAAWEQKVNN